MRQHRPPGNYRASPTCAREQSLRRQKTNPTQQALPPIPRTTCNARPPLPTPPLRTNPAHRAIVDPQPPPDTAMNKTIASFRGRVTSGADNPRRRSTAALSIQRLKGPGLAGCSTSCLQACRLADRKTGLSKGARPGPGLGSGRPGQTTDTQDTASARSRRCRPCRHTSETRGFSNHQNQPPSREGRKARQECRFNHRDHRDHRADKNVDRMTG